MAGEFVILADISNTVPWIHSITMICAAVILVPLVIKGARRLLTPSLHNSRSKMMK
jgi:hypothetical protein